MSRRTTIILDDESDRAAKELSRKLGCSTSEVIRKAILRYRDLNQGVSPERRAQRVAALQKLIELFEGNDADAEVARLKEEDEGS